MNQILVKPSKARGRYITGFGSGVGNLVWIGAFFPRTELRPDQNFIPHVHRKTGVVRKYKDG